MNCCLINSINTNNNNNNIDLNEDYIDLDHTTQRSHLQYSIVRFQCMWMRHNNGNNNTQNINSNKPLAVETILNLWERIVILTSTTTNNNNNIQQYRRLLPPLARLLGLLATAGVTPYILRRMITLASSLSSIIPTTSSSSQQQSNNNSSSNNNNNNNNTLLLARLCMVRALKTAASGASRSPLLSKRSPQYFFCFGGGGGNNNNNNDSDNKGNDTTTTTNGGGLTRTINGLSSWPFRNDFGMSVWFRAEQFDDNNNNNNKPIILLSVRTEDGGGIEISIVPIEKSFNTKSNNKVVHACTIAIAIYDSGKKQLPSHYITVRGGCVLLPRVWYHLAIRHTRSRLKGVFSLSTRQQISVMLDGKTLMTESLPFPKISDGTDFNDDPTSLLKSAMRRSAIHSSLSITISFCNNFDGQTGSLHIYNDNVSDSSFRALYELTGGRNSGKVQLKRTHSIGDAWVDAQQRNDIMKKSRMLDASMTKDDADEIVLSQKRTGTGSGISGTNGLQSGGGNNSKSNNNNNSIRNKKKLFNSIASVVDLATIDSDYYHHNDTDETDVVIPNDLQKAAFASKVFITWDPRRTTSSTSTSSSLALELHIGAHVNLDNVYTWGISGAQDVISSTGGIQTLIPLFRSFLNGDIERIWTILSSKESYNNSNNNNNNEDNTIIKQQRYEIFTIIPDLFNLLSAFVQDHSDNARELLRCGGIDIIEQLLHNCRKIAAATATTANAGKQQQQQRGYYDTTLFGVINTYPNLAKQLVISLLKLRTACTHYVGLETKFFTRILFNIPLWFSNVDTIPGSALHTILLPVLSSLTRINTEKVRECVGVKDMIYAIKEYNNNNNNNNNTIIITKNNNNKSPRVVAINNNNNNNVDRFIDTTNITDNNILGMPLTLKERERCTNIMLGTVFYIMSSGTSPRDLSVLIHLLSYCLDPEVGASFDAETYNNNNNSNLNRRKIAVSLCTLLLFLLQLRPPVPGLYESFAHTCGGVQGGISWILSSMVNSTDDEIRALGIRCVAAYLDVTTRGADLPLSLGPTSSSSVLLQNTTTEINTTESDVSSTVRLASSTITQIAKGIASMGPTVRSIVLSPSKLTARVVFKLLWHLLKINRASLGEMTHLALLSWITVEDDESLSSLASYEFVRTHMVLKTELNQSILSFNVEWIRSTLAEAGKFSGKPLRNPLAIGTILRLLRFLENEYKDRWLADLLTMTKSNRKCVVTLSSLPEWQPCLFALISETLELVSSRKLSASKSQSTDQETCGVSTQILHERLNRCLRLYSILLGHLLRSGGDNSLEAVERAAALERVFLNGRHVLFLILSSLCTNIFDDGTLLEVGTPSAQVWKDVDLEQESVVLKHGAKLVTDAILSNGMKGLDLTVAVRSWRSVRHLTEIIVAIAAKCGFGVVDLFDYVNHKAASLDLVTGGLHGIRLPEDRLKCIDATEYENFIHQSQRLDGKPDREIDRRLCVRLASQMLILLDSFIFPEASDVDIPAGQVDGLALVRFSEARLGKSQGPLISSAMRLSFLLLVLVEPCSVIFLQCASRLRCLLCWALELLRESNELEGHNATFHKDGTAHIDRLVLAVVLHCHRALGRCAALLSEIEMSSSDQYFENREAQKRHYRRLLRVGLELRDVVSLAYKGRNDFLHATISSEAYEALRDSLEGASFSGKPSSKESVVREFLSSRWVTGFQDTIGRLDLAVPEQVCMDTIPLSSDETENPLLQGFVAIEKLAQESSNIVSDFEKAINNCFEEYLELQRKFAETEAVRDLEYDGDSVVRRLSDKHKSEGLENVKAMSVRKTGTDKRWRGIQRKVTEPWRHELHWKLARYTDLLGRRMLLVQNNQFNDHSDASYDLTDKDKSKENTEKDKRIMEKKELTEVMRRNAEAFIINDSQIEVEIRDDESSLLPSSEGEYSTDLETSTDGESIENNQSEALIQNIPTDEEEPDEGWDKIDSEEIEDVDAEGESDAWAKAFIWAENESIVARFEPVMIVSLQTFVEGKVLLTSHGLYFHQVGDEINVMTKEAIDTSDSPGAEGKDRRWRLTRLVEVHGRRYMLRPQALELFFSDSHELLLNFPSGAKDRDRFYSKLRHSCRVPLLWSPKSLSPRVIFRKSKLTELWKKRKISNFEYLMALNRMAGRSFNDLTQYPVFPWVLADYTSETIDLTDSRVYRDLSKPVGALNPDRLAQLLERYKDLELFGFSEAEKFLYGSHYSSPGIVLHFLIRQEPFTSMAIDLQSGRFDCPDRLFFDIADSWNSCLTSTSDMKELIPEFYCFPEMFLNTNKFPLGRTQSGRVVDDVGLPPWAKGSAYEFVRIHRLALESDYVSENLHHWIDLIFGYKQRGESAISAHNLFHHLSYEGSVDLDKITDEVDRTAAESHIQNFGQTPSQLAITDPHPGRYSAELCWKPLIGQAAAARNLRCNTPSKQFANQRGEFGKGALMKIHVQSDTLIAIFADMSIGTYRWVPCSKSNRLRMDRLRPFARRELSTSRAATKRGSAISPECMERSSLAIGNWSFAVTLGGLVKEELRRSAVVSSGRLISASETSLSGAESSAIIVSCGYWDETVKAHSIDVSKLLSSETGGHHGAIRCLAMGQDGALMVTGGQDATARVWVVDHPDMSVALSDGYVQTALGGSNDGEQMLTCCHVLWGHDSPIVCVDLDSNSDIVVTGSEAGLVCIHTLRRGDFIRSFRPPSISSGGSTTSSRCCSVSKIAVGTEGNLVIHMSDQQLHTYTVNAVCLCSVDAGENLNDMKICSNDEILVTGGDRCHVLVRKVMDLQLYAMLDLTRHGPIHCIAFTPTDLNPIQQFLFIGSDDGMITIVDEDPMSSQKDNAMISF